MVRSVWCHWLLSNDEDTLEKFTQALSELLSSLCKNADMALNGEWDRCDEGFIAQIEEINEFCHKFNYFGEVSSGSERISPQGA